MEVKNALPIAAVIVIVTLLAALWPSRPLVEYAIAGLYETQPPFELDFRAGPTRLQFLARNRGGSDAWVFVSMRVTNGYLAVDQQGACCGQQAPGVFNTEMQYTSKLDSQSKEYGVWVLWIKPAEKASEIRIDLTVTKRFTPDISGVTNLLFGEYTALSTPLIYVNTSPSIYRLKR